MISFRWWCVKCGYDPYASKPLQYFPNRFNEWLHGKVYRPEPESAHKDHPVILELVINRD